eukprot:6489700-Amphidinium_carterae.1
MMLTTQADDGAKQAERPYPNHAMWDRLTALVQTVCATKHFYNNVNSHQYGLMIRCTVLGGPLRRTNLLNLIWLFFHASHA